jgi:hypothetical protein
MSGSGLEISSSDFVTIQNKAESLLGTGAVTQGYGQPVQSADVFRGNTITKAQWDALRFDIINIRLHQDGVLPPIVTVNKGDPISYGASSPNTNYNTLLETAIANRFSMAGNQSIVTAKGSATTSSDWSTSASMELTITFTNSDRARYFFNSGGRIRITPILTSSTGTAQVNAWLNFLTSVGTRSFGATTDPSINYYTLTNVYQTYYQDSLSTPYSANNINFSAKTNVANNTSGTASVLYLKVTLNDAYVDIGPEPPGDVVSGTLTISVDELKASGSLLPSGLFSVVSPAYSLSSIAVS